MTAGPARTIAALPELVDALPQEGRDSFDRIYEFSTATARLRVPPEMTPWVEKTFGRVEAVETQQIVRVSNRVTGEGTLFNELRARRPVRTALKNHDDFEAELADDAWRVPEKATPEDTFGRLSNNHGITAANVAKYDAVHSIVVFTEPNPLHFTLESVLGHLELAKQWIDRAHNDDPEAKYPYVMWNCLWRAGGSIVHGHTQVSLARGRHYAKIERLRRDAIAYRSLHGRNYFDDLANAHAALGLSLHMGRVHAMAHLTPVKEKECVLIADALDDAAGEAIFRTVSTFRDAMGVRSFNVGILLPPVASVGESWDGFPVLIRIVDRGDLSTRTSDIGGMEMYAESVVAADPFAVHQALTGTVG